MTRTLVDSARSRDGDGLRDPNPDGDTRQSSATQTALERGRFDLDGPTATAVALSRDYIQPAVQGPWVSGLQRAEYTVGVEGCGKRTTYVVLCRIGSSACFAAHTADRFQVPVGAGR